MLCFSSVVAVSIVSSSLAATPQQPEWSTKYGEALIHAKTVQRPLLIILEDGSQPNQRLGQVDPTDDKTQNIFLNKYVLCRIDVSTAYGKQIANAFHAATFPYIVITDLNVKQIVYRRAGPISDEDWVSTLVSYQDGKTANSITASRVRQRRQRGFSRISPSPENCPT